MRVLSGRVDLRKRLDADDGRSLAVQIGQNLWGRVDVCDLSDVDDWIDKPLSQFSNGQFVKVGVLEPRETGPKRRSAKKKASPIVALTMRSSEIESATECSEPEFSQGSIVKGYVVGVNSNGCFVRLSRKTTGRIMLKNLADTYVKDPRSSFPIGRLVAGKITSVGDGKVELSLKQSTVLGRESKTHADADDVRPGEVVEAIVSKIERFGMFLNLVESPRVSGLAHVSELTVDGSMKSVKDIERVYSVGDLVSAFVVKNENGRIAFSLKSTYFDSDVEESADDDDGDEDENENDDDDDDADDAIKALAPEDGGPYSSDEKGDVVDVSSDDDDDEDSQSDQEQYGDASVRDAVARLLAKRNSTSSRDSDSDEAAEADSGDDDTSSDESSNDASDMPRAKKSRLRQDDEIRAVEKRLRTTVVEKEEVMASESELSQLLLVEPNSSEAWIRLIALYLSRSELKKAISTAQRGIHTISHRREDERFNVWVALLNLTRAHDRHAFEGFAKEFVLRNDAKKALLALVDLHVRSDDFDQARETLKKCRKKTAQVDPEVWLRTVEVEFLSGDVDRARASVKDALRRLPKKLSVEFIIGYVRLEFTLANDGFERARIVCDNLLETHPKRIDVWFVVVDMETKYSTNAKARNIRVRSIFSKLTASETLNVNKGKKVFRKWLDYETTCDGVSDAQRLRATEDVKKRAKAFIARIKAREEGSDEESSSVVSSDDQE